LALHALTAASPFDWGGPAAGKAEIGSPEALEGWKTGVGALADW
jgi:hypothetical protein